jgi:hypothetical protein
MQRVSRYALAAVSVLLLASVVVVVLFAGAGLFGAGPMSLHIDLGWVVHGIPLLILLLLWPARPGRRIVQLSIVLFALVAIQPFLPLLRQSVPMAAALHPVNALLIFWLAVTLAQRTVALARSPLAEAPEPVARPEVAR